MTEKPLCDIQKAHDLAVAYTARKAASKNMGDDLDTFFHEYEKAYEHFLILICQQQ